MLKNLINGSLLRQIQPVLKNKSSICSVYQKQYTNYNFTSYRCVHTTLPNRIVVVSHENNYAYDVVNKLQTLVGNHPRALKCEIDNMEDFNSLLDQDWRSSKATEIVETFEKIRNFCIQNNINLSDNRFDKLVDGLMDNCENLTVDELMKLLKCIGELPLAERFDSHNFHDIWSCLDDMCCWRITDWDTDTALVIAKLWYKLHLGRICDYTFILVDRFSKKANRLTKEQLITIFFCFNICRSRAVDFEYEYALANIVNTLDSDELAVIALGYFKTKTKIKLHPIMKAMVDKVIQDCENIHEISLTAILKILRLSTSSKCLAEINHMLDLLTNQIPRLSTVCNLHIALLGTSYLQHFHPASIKKVCDKIVTVISDVEKFRLKDIERILLTLTMFEFDPKTTPDIFQECYIEIHKPSRLAEETKYVRSLVSLLFYLSIKKMYSYELMDRVLDREFIKINFGNSAKLLPRELLALDCSIDIECPGYKGTRLDPDFRYKGSRWITDFIPSQKYKKTKADEFYIDVVESMKGIVEEKCITMQHILPHFVKADIILCRDKITNKFIQPQGFQRYVLGDVMFPIEDPNLEWFAVIVVTWTNTIRETSLPLGQLLMKKRQLQKIGYKPIFVIWNEFLNLTPEAKRIYISNKIKI